MDDDDDRSLSASEAAAALGVAAETLRYWERAGLLAPVGRDSRHRRRYRAADLGYLDIIRRLRLTGMPVGAVRAFSDRARTGPATTGTVWTAARAPRRRGGGHRRAAPRRPRPRLCPPAAWAAPAWRSAP